MPQLSPQLLPQLVPQLRLICVSGVHQAALDMHLCLNSGVEAEFIAQVFHERGPNFCPNFVQVEAELRQKLGHKLGSKKLS